MVPGWSGTQRLARRFGTQIVRRLALGGESLEAGQALSLGLVDQVVEAGESLAAARIMAGRIAGHGPLAVETAKLMLNAAEGEDQAAAIEALGGGLVARTGDLAEGVEAFKARRPARFQRRMNTRSPEIVIIGSGMAGQALLRALPVRAGGWSSSKRASG